MVPTSMEQLDTTARSRVRPVQLAHAAWPLAASLLAMSAFHEIGDNFAASWLLDLGSLTIPTVRHTYFLFYWTLLGSAAAFFLVVGATRLFALWPAAPGPRVDPAGDRNWMLLMAALAFGLACAIRSGVLRNAPLTDDESAYRFMAEVLATGRLWATSHPMKTFFDRIFMVNDGKVYAQYFIGWPALMVPAVYFGATGYINALYSALTVPAVFGILRRLAGPSAARIGTLLYVASPMLMIGAATEMAHPSCTMALAWSFYFGTRVKDRPDAWWTHAGVAFFFGVAFLVRPSSALGVGLPILIWWAYLLTTLPAAARVRGAIAFALPAAALAAVFFGVNLAQNGSPLTTSYARVQAYMKEVNYQWVGWSPGSPPSSLSDYMLPSRHVGRALAATTIGLIRLTYDLFATPVALLLIGFAWAARSARVAWLSLLSFLAFHFFTGDSGVDTFGPVHYYELCLPVIILCGIGYARLAEQLHAWRPSLPESWPMALVASVIVLSLAGFAPVRFAALSRIADNVNAPADAVRAAGIHNAVIFTAGIFTPQQCIAPTRHFVYFRPNNDPALTNDILWVNHLGWEVDHELMRYFPGRAGYLLTWNGCRPELTHL
jgi:hypothetical protein